jgi:hypothetical protein
MKMWVNNSMKSPLREVKSIKEREYPFHKTRNQTTLSSKTLKKASIREKANKLKLTIHLKEK